MGCGLMQKWNKIQQRKGRTHYYKCCGLMQKWNKIQHADIKLKDMQVVV